ncbi:DUF1853 family protein [Mariniflexile gromovii]|uniref:DUF1853 family protein n=1 Tax=Mariniflexile gromovii TaxID=362523 RepID=A0ABS4BYN8_9FLAO|nr:DUF1853 family protein [Mariniflexile gromovii]MBP0905702.1 DUF1853 family protein [Mariniflexile gromovii]
MIQKRYEGFLKTPCLWKSKDVFSLQQFEIISESQTLNIEIDEQLRLGKYVERLVAFELEMQSNISIIAENIQIQDEKTTLGEIDCLLLKDGEPIHLEIIYKFYLYDASVGTTEIDHFVGPNRKDSLKEKLTKLRDKQLPLLYNNMTEKYLTALELNQHEIKQQVYFKAQLFAPFANKNIQLKVLNTACFAGLYVNKNQLHELEDCKFYIPNKKDWLIVPHPHVNWMLFDAFNHLVKDYFQQQYSPLCWIKFKNGQLTKIFLVWW